jgi:hypothetical protein
MIRPKAIVVGGEAAEAAATGLPAFAEQGHRVASSAPLSWGKESSRQKHRGRDSTFDPSAANIEQDFPGAGDRSAVPVTASPVLATARFRGAHGYRAVLIDLNHVPSEAAAVDSPPEALSGLGDDRVGVGTSLNGETLRDLFLQVGVERVLASSERIDFSVHRHLAL